MWFSSFNYLAHTKDCDRSAVIKGVVCVLAVNTDSPAQPSRYIIISNKYKPISSMIQYNQSSIKAWGILSHSSGKNATSSVHLSHSLPFPATSSGEQVLRALHHSLMYLPWYQSPLWVSDGFLTRSACLLVQVAAAHKVKNHLLGILGSQGAQAEMLITYWGWALRCASNTHLNSRKIVTFTRPEDIYRRREDWACRLWTSISAHLDNN